MASSDDEDCAEADSTRPEISVTDNDNKGGPVDLPNRSREKYEKTFNSYMEWNKSDQPFSEDTLLQYFKELSGTLKPSSMWPIFSMLKATIWLKHRVNINEYKKLVGLLKKLNVGFKPTITPALPEEGVWKFLTEAPDYHYLSMKVTLIFALSGLSMCSILSQIKTKNIEQHGEMLLVKYPNMKCKNWSGSFVIQGDNYHIVKKYQALRPKHTEHDRFFVKYHNGKCSTQPIGVNTFGDMPKKIAIYLVLPNPESYTGYSLKKTSIAMQGQARVTGRCKRYLKEKKKEASVPQSEIDFEKSLLNSDEDSMDSPNLEDHDPFSSHRDNSMSPIHVKPEPKSRPVSPSIDRNIKVFAESFNTPDKYVTFNFNNCRFSRCFNK